MQFNERIADTLTGGGLTQARQQNEQMLNKTELLTREVQGLTRKVESFQDGSFLKEDAAGLDWVNRTQQDRGWALISGVTLHRIIEKSEVEIYADLANFMWTFSPLIRRIVDIKTQFTFSKLFTISSKSDNLQNIIDAVMEEPINKNAVFSKQALTEIDIELQKDGQVFLAVYLQPLPAMTQIRIFTVYEITDIIYDKDDSARPLFYLRTWLDNDNAQKQKLYPSAFNEQPMINLTGKYSSVEIDRTVIVYHMSVKKGLNQKWALTELTPVLRWARAHEGFLEDFGAIVKAIRKYSSMFQSKGGTGQVTGLANQFQADATGAPNGMSLMPGNPAGSMLVSEVGNDFKVIDAGAGKIVGAQDGRYFLLMVCAGSGVPETLAMGDPSTGNLATAKELSGPFMDQILDRQTAWRDTFTTVFTLILGKGAKFEVSFPVIRTSDVQQYINSLISAFTLDGKTPAGTLLTEDFIKGLYETLEIKLPEKEVLDQMVADLEQLAQDATQTPTQGTLDQFGNLATAAKNLEARMKILEMSQSGVPKPVLTTAKSARDQLKSDIEDLRDEISNAIGI